MRLSADVTEPVEANQLATDEHLSETRAAKNDNWAEDLDGGVALRLFITGKFEPIINVVSQTLFSDIELQCTTEGFDSPALDTVRLAVVGLATGEEAVWLLKKVSEDTWKQASSVIDL